MQDIHQRELKMQDKRKQTPRRQFLKEVASRFGVGFYKNNGIISRFPETDRCGTIYNADAYMKQFHNGFPGVDLLPDVPFLEQFQKFFATSPKMALLDYANNENVRYADTTYGAKNAYMTISVGDICENVLYSIMIFGNCTNIINSSIITSNCENIYRSVNVTHSFNVFYSRYIHNSANIRFSDNLIGCTDCVFCSWLENKKYHIHNTAYTPQDFLQEKQKILSQKSEYFSYFQKVSWIATPRSVNNCTWNAISFSENVQQSYFVSRVTNGRNILWGDGTPLSSNLYDVVDISKVDDAYGWMGVGQNAVHMYCGANASTCNNVYYSYFMDTCSYCLWCIWLKNKQFCILNKEYTKDERYVLVDKIFGQMDADWSLWAFFSPSTNPFYFNDTLAYLVDDSFTQDEVTKEGYLRREDESRVDIPEWADVVNASDLAYYQWFDEQWNRKITPEILKKAIKDDKWNYYKIMPMELDFLQKHGLPLPEIHRLERIKLWFKFK